MEDLANELSNFKLNHWFSVKAEFKLYLSVFYIQIYFSVVPVLTSQIDNGACLSCIYLHLYQLFIPNNCEPVPIPLQF
jgi:hypothetical protein